jgi:SulP family sulfate permease
MIFAALRQSIADRSLLPSLRVNLLAGLTVGIVALPLSMGLAIASGVAPQHGLYTAIVGGIVIALTGGSRVNISGPTAAFVVVLLPVVHQFGLGGLLLSGAMAGVMLILFGLARLGRLIRIVPYPVIIGFTSGIGVVIAFLQLKDFLGLKPQGEAVHFVESALLLVRALPGFQWQECAIGALTLAVLVGWKRLHSRIPSYLVALLVGAFVAAALNASALAPPIETIASRFSYAIDGATGAGIPPLAPELIMPWDQPGPDGQPLGLSLELIRILLGAAFSIAVLGALESLLCAVVADGMSGFRHDPDGELIGQGLGNIAVAFLGGIPATAAIARTATNVRSGATTPLAAVIHGVVVLLSMLLFARWLGYIPMAAMAAVLMMVAWNMSEAHHAWRILKRAPRADAAVFLTCFLLTVVIDMQVAVAGGLVLASVLFIRRMAELTGTAVLRPGSHEHERGAGPGVVIYDIDGPLFFGAAHKALKVISAIDDGVHTVVLDFADVNLLDATAMINIGSIGEELAARKVGVALLHVKPRLVAKMRRFGLLDDPAGLRLIDSLAQLGDPAASAAR